MFPRLPSFLLLGCVAVSASVVRVEVAERSDVLDGKSMGPSGPYERMIAKVHFLVDPKLPTNQIISDIDLAPRNEQGKVEFSADIYVLKPRDPARGNGTLLFEVPNRGRIRMMDMFCQASPSLDPRTERDFGDAFLLEQGFTLAWLGWQFDVPHDPRLLRLYAPVARDGEKPAFPLVVPQVDSDGNETSGIRMPEVRVPPATYTVWNLRDPSLGAPDELFSMAGSFIPFARTTAERGKTGDPRPSVEERYEGREDYLEKVPAAARDLVRGGYLLERDLPKIVERASTHWNHLIGSN